MLNIQLSDSRKNNRDRGVHRQDFDTALKQYRIGRVEPLKLNLKKYGDSFTHPLFIKIESRLSYDEWCNFQQLGNLREDALKAVRRGEFDIAEGLFAQARIPLEENSLSSEAKLLHQTFLEQAQSYLDYCRGDFERVYTRMFDALAIDLILEEEYDYDIMVIHRIQLLHNLVRTEARCGCFKRAMEIASTLLGYLQGTLGTLPFYNFCGRQRLRYQAQEVLAATFSQITSEIALILAAKDTQTAKDLLAITLHHLQVPPTNQNYLHLQSYQWFLLKQAMVNDNIASFLEKTGCFLASGRADTPLLWYVTAVDLFNLCKKFDFPESKLILQEIRQDAPKWELCSKRLLALID